MMKKIKSAAKTLWKGFMRSLYGTAVAATIALAVYGYVMVPADEGYTAVVEFVVATLTMVVGLCGMYVMGGRAKRGAY